jgi:hypothetical protein
MILFAQYWQIMFNFIAFTDAQLWYLLLWQLLLIEKTFFPNENEFLTKNEI